MHLQDAVGRFLNNYKKRAIDFFIGG